MAIVNAVIPAKAGMTERGFDLDTREIPASKGQEGNDLPSYLKDWIPVFTGMTVLLRE